MADSASCEVPAGQDPLADPVGRILLELLSRATSGATVLVVEARGDLLEVVATFDPRARRVPRGRTWPTTDPLWAAARVDRAVMLGTETARRSAVVACGPGSVAVVGPAPAAPAGGDPFAVVLLPRQLGAAGLAAAVPLVEHTTAALAEARALRHDVEQARREAREARRALEKARQDTTNALRSLVSFATEARTDPLTGLANRRALRERIVDAERTAQSPGRAGVLVIDLDELKSYNDSNGHPAGDLLLVRTADALRSAVEDTDLPFRVGGDEFVVLSVGAVAKSLTDLEGRVRQALAARGIAASVGAALCRPGSTVETTWQEADRLMYLTKRRCAPSPPARVGIR